MNLSAMTPTTPGPDFQGAFASSLSEANPGAGLAAIKLLHDGLEAMEDDRGVAIAYFKRAYALLESVHGRSQPALHSIVRGGLAPWQIRSAIAFIDANLEQPITNRDLSLTVRLSPDYFARAFKHSFGVTPQTYICRRRLAHAQQLMLATDEPLCEIARSCGFGDQAHFTRRFRLSIGATPHSWRRARLGCYRVAA